MTSSSARYQFPNLQDAAALHEPTLIRRRRGPSTVLVSDEDLRAILAAYTFSPEIFREDEAVSIWLPELAIWGRGASVAEASDDLLEEIEQLLALLAAEERFRTSPAVLQKMPWLYRLMLTPEDEARLGLLFAAPAEAAHAFA